jgi:RimJ/RimL family protein N-acetyltransferase
MQAQEAPQVDGTSTAGPGPAYRIHTRRLVLRCWQPADAPLLQAAIEASLEHLRPWMPWARHEPEELQVKVARLRRWRGQFDLGEECIYGIFDREETRVLGGSGLHTRVGPEAREIGYWIHADYINQGLATEATAALTKVAFEIDGVSRIEIHCDPNNVRSLAVPRKLGFCHEATLRQRARTPAGAPRDTMIWTMLAAEYSTSPAAAAEIEALDVVGCRLL